MGDNSPDTTGGGPDPARAGWMTVGVAPPRRENHLELGPNDPLSRMVNARHTFPLQSSNESTVPTTGWLLHCTEDTLTAWATNENLYDKAAKSGIRDLPRVLITKMFGFDQRRWREVERAVAPLAIHFNLFGKKGSKARWDGLMVPDERRCYFPPFPKYEHDHKQRVATESAWIQRAERIVLHYMAKSAAERADHVWPDDVISTFECPDVYAMFAMLAEHHEIFQSYRDLYFHHTNFADDIPMATLNSTQARWVYHGINQMIFKCLPAVDRQRAHHVGGCHRWTVRTTTNWVVFPSVSPRFAAKWDSRFDRSQDPHLHAQDHRDATRAAEIKTRLTGMISDGGDIPVPVPPPSTYSPVSVMYACVRVDSYNSTTSNDGGLTYTGSYSLSTMSTDLDWMPLRFEHISAATIHDFAIDIAIRLQRPWFIPVEDPEVPGEMYTPGFSQFNKHFSLVEMWGLLAPGDTLVINPHQQMNIRTEEELRRYLQAHPTSPRVIIRWACRKRYIDYVDGVTIRGTRGDYAPGRLWPTHAFIKDGAVDYDNFNIDGTGSEVKYPTLHYSAADYVREDRPGYIPAKGTASLTTPNSSSKKFIKSGRTCKSGLILWSRVICYQHARSYSETSHYPYTSCLGHIGSALELGAFGRRGSTSSELVRVEPSCSEFVRVVPSWTKLVQLRTTRCKLHRVDLATVATAKAV